MARKKAKTSKDTQEPSDSSNKEDSKQEKLDKQAEEALQNLLDEKNKEDPEQDPPKEEEKIIFVGWPELTQDEHGWQCPYLTISGLEFSPVASRLHSKNFMTRCMIDGAMTVDAKNESNYFESQNKLLYCFFRFMQLTKK